MSRERKKPQYWGTDKGEVLTLLTIYGAVKLSDMESLISQMAMDLTTSKVLITLEELIRDGCVYLNEKDEYRVKDDLYREYSDYEYYMDSEEEPSFEDEYVNSEEIYRRTHSWIDFHKLDISLENRHFFLDGHYLDIFIKFILKNARRTIIVVNPFIDLSTPAQLLIEAKQQGKTVVLVTRPHSTQRAKDVHKTLANSRISILYHENLHAKIIMIDDSLAIITSMNFIQRATAGVSWEAGLVTIDKWVVSKIKESITDLNPESAKL